MAISHTLSELNPSVFENLVNALALKTLGNGATGFGPGADGGRDGYFQGEAPYPSSAERWSGVWYIQSKFYSRDNTVSERTWLIDQVKKEIESYSREDSDRQWPDIWIIATNVEPGGKPETGSFDQIKKLVRSAAGAKEVKVAIWGGRKILDLLSVHENVATYYGHFLTPGHVVSKLIVELEALHECKATVQDILRYFVVTQFSENLYTKLEQAGSSSDIRPTVHDLFIDLPFSERVGEEQDSDSFFRHEKYLSTLCAASAQPHRYSLRKGTGERWREWYRSARQARVTLIKGGPGQGKSTLGQYFCQIQRAFLIFARDQDPVSEGVTKAVEELRLAAEKSQLWPTTARVPIQIELKEYAHWHSQRKADEP